MLCACGCGQETNRDNKWLKGHGIRVPWSDARRARHLERIRSLPRVNGKLSKLLSGNEEWRALSDKDRLNGPRERVRLRLSLTDVLQQHR